MSQLISPVSSSAGESAKAAASQGRRGLTPASSQADSSASAAKPSALTMTKTAQLASAPRSVPTSVADRLVGARVARRATPVSQCVTQAAPYAQ